MSESAAPSAPNGLASLAKQRARRAMPPPRHPSKAPASGAAAGGGVAGKAMAAAAPATHIPALPREVAGVDETPKSDVVFVPATTPAKPATVYLDDLQVNFLEQARIAGLISSPRLDLSKSAVVRLALRRLQEQMTIDEICALLRSQPVDPTKTGRKKR